MESQAAARWQSRRHAAAVTEQFRAEGRWRTGEGRAADGQTWTGEWMTDRRIGSEKVGWRGRWEREQQ